MPTHTLTKQETALVETGRTQDKFPTIGDMWWGLKGSPCYDTLANQYENIEEAIEEAEETPTMEYYGTKENGDTYRIGSAPGRPKPVGTRPS